MTTNRILTDFSTRLRSVTKLDILLRTQSTQAEEKCIFAKSFEELTKLSKFQFLRRSLPGGTFFILRRY